MRIYIAEKKILERVLQRKKWAYKRAPTGVDIGDMLRSILMWANEFVPSESGSILIDDPFIGKNQVKPGRLYFLACFGKGSGTISGTSLPLDIGIVGKTYKTGKPYISKNVEKDFHFYSKIDQKTKYRTKSIICVPVKIKDTTIGVLELINRSRRVNYDHRDLQLLKIFAGYTSTLIQNSLDAKRFAELSIRDNLTWLFNDRYFFERLTKEISVASRKKKDLSLVFLDLDRFKEVNDTHGHLAGSQLLAELGTIVSDCIQGMDAIPVRYGGDEFTVILPGMDIKEACRFSEALRETIEKHVFLDHRVPGLAGPLRIKGLITASLGVASLKANVKRTSTMKLARETLISAADTAMYASKDKGRNMVTTAPRINAKKVAVKKPGAKKTGKKKKA